MSLLIRSLALALATALSAGCVAAQSPEEKRQQCGELADLVSEAHLAGSPTAEQATDVANRMDSKLSRLRTPSVHDAAVDVHAELHRIQIADEKGDDAKTQEKIADARSAARDLADACDLPAERFLGTE